MNYYQAFNNKVLFVDDEELILEKIKEKLAGNNFEMYFADSGKAAVELINEINPAAAVIDLNMNDFSGIELIKIIKNKYPDTVIIIFSVYADSKIILKTFKHNIYQYIPKNRIYKENGYQVEVIPAVKNALEKYNLLKENKNLKKLLMKGL